MQIVSPDRKKVLVTGGSGFVGANLVRYLLAGNYEVHLLVRPNHQGWRLREIEDQITLHKVDLSRDDRLQEILLEIRPHWVFHLAAYGAYSWQEDSQQIHETNLQGTIRLLEACVKTGFEAFIHTGSSSEYGYVDHAPKETEAPVPNSHYAFTKAAATLYCQFTANREDAPILSLRLYSAYGPFEDPRRLVPALISNGLQGKLPPLVAPETARDYVFVTDIVEAFILAAQQAKKFPGEIYNLGSGVQTPLRRIVDTICRILPIEDKPVWGTMPARRWDTDVWIAAPEKAADDLGWIARTDLESGLRSTIDWHRSARL